MLLCDTGVLLAAGNVKDHAHQTCLRLLRQADGPLLVPSPVLGEIGYNHGQRVVAGQRLMQAASDIFLAGSVPGSIPTAGRMTSTSASYETGNSPPISRR